MLNHHQLVNAVPSNDPANVSFREAYFIIRETRPKGLNYPEGFGFCGWGGYEAPTTLDSARVATTTFFGQVVETFNRSTKHHRSEASQQLSMFDINDNDRITAKLKSRKRIVLRQNSFCSHVHTDRYNNCGVYLLTDI